LISPATKKAIDKWLKKYPPEQKRSAVIEALHLVQHENNGWLTTELLDTVADYLGMDKIAVYEVATFYSMFNLKPVGKHMINVCTNLSCMLCGSQDILAHLEKRLGIKAGETTADGKYSLVAEGECLAACGGAPMMQIDHKTYYENLTPQRVDEILNEIDKQGTGA